MSSEKATDYLKTRFFYSWEKADNDERAVRSYSICSWSRATSRSEMKGKEVLKMSQGRLRRQHQTNRAQIRRRKFKLIGDARTDGMVPINKVPEARVNALARTRTIEEGDAMFFAANFDPAW